MSKPRVLRAVVVDDSAYNRVTISRMLESTGEIRVASTAVNGEDAIKQVVRHRPDVVTLDLEMPVMDGFAFLRWLMMNQPTPVVVVSSRSSDRSVFKALELGAVDFIAKPGGRVSPRLEEIERDLVGKIRSSVDARLDLVAKRIHDDPPPAAPARSPVAEPAAVDLVVIGSSTGGPPALQSLFQSTARIPVPFVVAQHMPATFTRLFAERVDRLTRLRVKEAEHAETLMPGTVYIAPGGKQCDVVRSEESLEIVISGRSEDDVYAPSVDRLFLSAAEACGPRLLGVILTGMGDDGTEGMQEIRRRGGRTIAESEESAIIFGMPGEAIRAGAVEEVLPLWDIPGAIVRVCNAAELESR
jgi:two-component system, chemotaxis family, protein-glutamate methylesterase/glutaminase